MRMVTCNALRNHFKILRTAGNNSTNEVPLFHLRILFMVHIYIIELYGAHTCSLTFRITYIHNSYIYHNFI